jgi:glycosyltransferase involved in cell wall biosynthesis
MCIRDSINYIYFPFDDKDYRIRHRNNSKIKIIHSPTNRKFKGTDKILEVIKEIDGIRQIEFILVENMDRTKVLEIKSQCDLAIDQVGGELGGSGYGKNSIENLSMGVPTFTEFTDEYLMFIKENPFIHSTIDTLKENMLVLIDNQILRNEIAIKGRLWVEKFHSYESVNTMLQKYYETHAII